MDVFDSFLLREHSLFFPNIRVNLGYEEEKVSTDYNQNYLLQATAFLF